MKLEWGEGEGKREKEQKTKEKATSRRKYQRIPNI